MLKRLTILWVGFIAIAAGAAEQDFQWRIDETFAFIEFHDPGYLVLEDPSGTRSELEFGYEGLTYAKVSQWPEGKAIRVVYSPEKGTEIVDPESGERFEIGGPIRIDDLLERCMAAAGPMTTMGSCQIDAAKAWDLELNRTYKKIMAGSLSDETKAKIRSAQRKWIEHRDASSAALSAWSAEMGGSVQRLEASIAIVELTRSQTRLLRTY